MTKEFKKMLDELEYVSMNDFCEKINNIKDMDEKIAFATEYLLAHKENADCSLEDAINIARMKMADGIIEYNEMKRRAESQAENSDLYTEEEKKSVDLKQYGNVENNKNLNLFMAYPTLFLSKAAAKKNDLYETKINANNILDSFDTKKVNNIERNMRILNESELNLNLDEKKLNILHITSRLKSQFGGAEALNNAFKASKPGFFSRMFNTTSYEGRNLLTAFKGFTSINSPLYGKKDTLERAATNYLKHLFPHFDTDYPLPDKHRIDQLSGTQKSRAILCKGILEAVRSEKKIDEVYNETVNSKKDINFDLDGMFDVKTEVKKVNIIDLDPDLEFEGSEFDNNLDSNSVTEKNEREL